MRDLVLVICEQMGTFNNLIKSLLLPQYFILLPKGLELLGLSSRSSLCYWWDSFGPIL